MATMILGTAGTVLGGPLGGAIGFALGSALDQTLFFDSDTGRERPSRSDSQVQNSAYGAPVPLVFGRARMAGNVIWSTGIRETLGDSAQLRGGKGGAPAGSTAERSYSASFAVAFSGRPLLRIERIWADGKLLRDAQGGVLVPFRMRFHSGTESQLPDPLIEAEAGAGQAPAYRGLAYAVFEDLPLAEFANRIPNITVEAVADETMSLGDCLGALAAPALDGPPSVTALDEPVAGFILARTSEIAATLEAIGRSARFTLSEGGGRLAFSGLQDAVPRVLQPADLGAAVPGERAARIGVSRDQGADLPQDLALRYADPARDYQPAVQTARRQQLYAAGRETIDSPLVLTADAARRLADRELALRWQGQERHSLTLPLSHADVAVGDRLSYEEAGRAVTLLVDQVSLERGRVALSGFPLSAQALAEQSNGVGDALPELVIAPPGQTVLHILDLPGTAANGDPLKVPAAVSGASPNWRGADIFISRDGGDSYDRLASGNAPAVIGTARTALAPGPWEFWDEGAGLEVELLRSDAELEARSRLSVLNGTNIAVIGEEIAQFREAALQPDGSYRLRGFLRGRAGTEHAIASHEAGERFVLLDGGAILSADVPLSVLGQTVLLKPVTLTRRPAETAAQPLRVTGQALKPLAPVHVRAARSETGDLTLRWVRRTRFQGAWLDRSDVPLNEEAEAYQIDIVSEGAVVRTLSAPSPQAVYSAADQSADFGAVPESIDIALYQMSAVVGRGFAWQGRV